MGAKVSIIVPCYNVEEYLDRCLESLVNQTFHDIEIILIDDGSTDNTGVKCDSWVNQDNRIIVHHQENKGLSGARNKGIELASCDYIIFVDSDDYVVDTMVEKLYGKATVNDFDFVYAAMSIVRNNEITEIWSNKRFFSHVANVLEYPESIFKISKMAFPKIIRRQILLDNRIWFPDRLYYEDQIFALNLILVAKKIGHITEPLHMYDRSRDSSITNNINALGDILIIHEMIDDLYKGNYRKEIKIMAQKNHSSYIASLKNNDSDASKQLTSQFINDYYKRFLLDSSVEKLKIGIYGGFASKATANKLFLDKTNIAFFQMRNNIIGHSNSLANQSMINIDCNNSFKKQCVLDDIRGEVRNNIINNKEKLDYIIIDFLECRLTVLDTNHGYLTKSDAYEECKINNLEVNDEITIYDDKYIALWKDACNKFLEFLEREQMLEKVIINELYLTEQYGNTKEKLMFDNIEEIKNTNKILSLMYGYVREKYPQIKIIKVSPEYNYCDMDTPYGIEPQYLCEYAYMQLAEDIYDVCLEDAKFKEI